MHKANLEKPKYNLEKPDLSKLPFYILSNGSEDYASSNMFDKVLYKSLYKNTIKLSNPNLKLKNFFPFNENITHFNKEEVYNFINKFTDQEYLYWDKFKYKEPSPKNIPKEVLWAELKKIRKNRGIITPIKDKNEKPFTWIRLNYFEKFFHELDMHTAGELFVDKELITKSNKQKIIINGIMEEAIASSQLEGAATSRQAAKKMLREGRKPRNASDQMIVNTYTAMKTIEDDYKNKAMTTDLILELHSLITKDTLDSLGEKPRMRYSGEQIYVSDHANIYHDSPEISFVKKELEKLIKFANDELGEKSFIHPVAKAIMLHFWIGYLHPFTDGNGRLARLLFYWYLVRNGYWAFAYLPISKKIKQSPKQYIMSYVYSEQDDNDLTYFIDYNIKKIQAAVQDFKVYLSNQANKNLHMNKNAEIKYNLNDRQIQLLQYLYGNFDESTTPRVHMNINQVTKATAIKDLKNLLRYGFIISKKRGRNIYYFGTKKIKELFN